MPAAAAGSGSAPAASLQGRRAVPAAQQQVWRWRMWPPCIIMACNWSCFSGKQGAALPWWLGYVISRARSYPSCTSLLKHSVNEARMW